MELPQVSNYFRLSSEMLSRTSSQICGRWYLPMFLFRDGIIYSYVQGFFYCSQEVMILSPQDGKVVNGDIMSRDVNMVMYGGWGLQMFLVPLFKIPC